MKREELNKELLDITENLLDENHVLSFRMQGYSMFPTLKDGDLGYVEKCSPNELKIGDIVVFKAHEKLIAHRLIGFAYQQNQKIFLAKGDKNNFNDLPISSDALVGKVTSFQRKTKIRKTDRFIMRFHRFTALYLSNVINPFYNLYLQVKNKFNYFYSNFQSIKANVSLISKKSGKIFLINALISVFQGIIPFILIFCIKLLIDQLTKSTVQDVHQQLITISILTITTLSFLIGGVLSELNSYFSEKLAQSVTRWMYEKLHLKHADLYLSNYENSDKQDKMHRAVQEASFRPIKMLNELLVGIKSIASSLFLVGMFLSIRWYLVLILFIAIIPGVYIRLRYSKKLYKLKELQNTKEREMFYYNRILTGFPFAKELKLFGFADFFKLRFTTVQNSLFEEKISLRKSEIKLGIFAQVFAVSLIFISLGFVSLLKIRGEISIGTVVLFFFAFQRGYSVLNDFFQSFTRILEDNTFLKDFIEFLNLPTQSEKTLVNSPFSLQKEICFENVSFRYESSKRDALHSINLVIPAGKTVAFVGANGSGKTTLIKLLCGFYQPDSGKILFDGIDANLIGQTKICENITAVFQDFALYNLAALENIRLGNSHIPMDLAKAKKAAQSAGIDEMIERLPDGYNTLLGSLFKGGEELSIGQWQKIAIARAFYRDSPLLLMDEPSSALDVDSEMQIINNLKRLSHQKTAVIVSHRLSTVEWVDLIYFFDKGEVLEYGSHMELMAMKGKYYNLFQTTNKCIESDSSINN